MSKLTDAVKKAADAEAAAETRIVAHETVQQHTIEELQSTVKGLQDGSVDANQAAADLDALANKLQGIDPDTTTTDPVPNTAG